jgi:NADH-quinone oxidoreductase subunit H
VLYDPTLRALALMGFAQLAVLAFLTLTPPRQVRREEAEAEAHGGHGHGGGHDDHAALPGHDAHAPAAVTPH